MLIILSQKHWLKEDWNIMDKDLLMENAMKSVGTWLGQGSFTEKQSIEACPDVSHLQKSVSVFGAVSSQK